MLGASPGPAVLSCASLGGPGFGTALQDAHGNLLDSLGGCASTALGSALV